MATTSTLQLTLLMLSTNLCLATWHSMTVMEGSTITLKCPLVSADDVPAEWRNPQGDIMFHDRLKGVQGKRYRMERRISTMFKISVSHVTFKDGGNYTCIQYSKPPRERTVAVTVLGQPSVKVLRHNRGVKCTAAGTHFPPQISWQFGDGIEIDAPPHITYESGIKKYYSEAMQPLKKRETICCIVRHPHLHGKLKNCITVTPAAQKIPLTTGTWSSTDEPRGSSTDSLKRMTAWPPTDQSTKDMLMAPNSFKASPEATNLEATARNRVSSTAIRLETMTTTSDQTTFTGSLSDQSQEERRGATHEPL